MDETNASIEISPLLIFVLGAPCAGKSTLCAALAQRWSLDHFSIGTEIRSLVSSYPTGHAARIKPIFTPEELAIFTKNVYAGTLGPAHQTPKYVKERIFPDDINVNSIRLLVDGFPRDVERWHTFKEGVKDKWQPNKRTMVVFLVVEKDLAHERFISRGRLGDEFEKRFVDHETSVEHIQVGMLQDGVEVLEIDVKRDVDIKDIVKAVETSDFWQRQVAGRGNEGGPKTD